MKKRNYFKWAITAFILLFLIIAVFQFDAEGMLCSLRNIPLWSVFLLIGLQIVTQFLINLQWLLVAKSFGASINFIKMLYVNAQAEIIHVAPAGHIGCDVFRAVEINRVGGLSGGQSAAVVAIQKLFSLSAFFIISLVSIGFFIGQVPWLNDIFMQLLLYGFLIAILVLLGYVFIAPHKILLFLNKKWHKDVRFFWVNKLRGFTMSSLNHVVYLKKNTGLFAKLTVIAVFIWTLYPLKLYLLAIQLLPDVGIVFIFAAAFLAYTIAMIPLFPGGLGGFEATLVGLLVFMGFLHSGALVITVLFRFVTFWFVVLLSIIYVALHKLVSYYSSR